MWCLEVGQLAITLWLWAFRQPLQHIFLDIHRPLYMNGLAPLDSRDYEFEFELTVHFNLGVPAGCSATIWTLLKLPSLDWFDIIGFLDNVV